MVRTYPIEADNIQENGASLKITVPVNWLRQYFSANGTLGLYIDADNPKQLVVTEYPIPGSELPAGSGVNPEKTSIG